MTLGEKLRYLREVEGTIRGLDRTAETVKKIPAAAKGHEEENR